MTDTLSTEDAVLKMMETERGKTTAYNCYYDWEIEKSFQRFLTSEEWSAVDELLKAYPPPVKRALDLGAGNGIASFSLCESGYSVISLEPDSSELVGYGALRKIVKVNSKPILSISGYGESLPFKDQSFGLVYVRQVLHHSTDLRKMLKEIFRVLLPNGILMATREHVVDGKQSLEKFLENHPLHKYTRSEGAYLLSDYLSVLNASGFRLEKLLLSFDSVINHYPISNSMLTCKFQKALGDKYGSVGRMISNLPFVEKAYRKRLSQRDKSPGRMISFVASKK